MAFLAGAAQLHKLLVTNPMGADRGTFDKLSPVTVWTGSSIALPTLLALNLVRCCVSSAVSYFAGNGGNRLIHSARPALAARAPDADQGGGDHGCVVLGGQMCPRAHRPAWAFAILRPPAPIMVAVSRLWWSTW